MIYLYGLAEADAWDLSGVLDGLHGLQAPLEVTTVGGWALVHSEQDDQEILPRRRLMLTHTRVVEQMLTGGTVLPARFGLVADSLGQARALVEGRADVIAREFDRIRGAVELGLRIRFPKEAALTATLAEAPDLRREKERLSGRGAEAHYAIAEFGGRLADRVDRRRGKAQAALLSALKPLARDHVLRAPEEDTEVLRAEFLVDRDAQDAFEAAALEAARKLDFAPGEDPAIQLVGPVPVYNFVRLSLSVEADEAAA